jgi:hypothetical protein
MRRKLADDNPSDLEYQSILAENLSVVGLILLAEGRDGEALDHFSREEAIQNQPVRSSRKTNGVPFTPCFR